MPLGSVPQKPTLFIPGWGQQNEHLLQHLLRHAPGIKSVEFPKPFLLQSLFFVDQLVCSTFRRFGKSLARFIRDLFIRMPRDFQTSRGNSHLFDSDRGEFLLKFELAFILVCSGMFHLQAQAPSCFTRPRAHHFLDVSGRLMQKLCGNFGSPTQQNAAGICSTDSTLFIPGWGQQNEHLSQHVLRQSTR